MSDPRVNESRKDIQQTPGNIERPVSGPNNPAREDTHDTPQEAPEQNPHTPDGPPEKMNS